MGTFSDDEDESEHKQDQTMKAELNFNPRRNHKGITLTIIPNPPPENIHPAGASDRLAAATWCPSGPASGTARSHASSGCPRPLHGRFGFGVYVSIRVWGLGSRFRVSTHTLAKQAWRLWSEL